MLHSVKFNTPNTKHTCLQIDAFVESLQWELDDQRSAAGAIIAAADDRDAAGVSSAADEEEGSGSAVLTRESPRLPSAAASGEGMRQGFLVRSMPTHQPPPPPPHTHSCTAAIADLVSWAAQTRAKLAAAHHALSLLAGARRAADSGSADAPEARVGAGAANELAKEVAAFAAESLAAWQAATAAWLQGVAGWKTSKLMSFDAHSRRVSAHFSDSLVVLLREVRARRACVACTGRLPATVSTWNTPTARDSVTAAFTCLLPTPRCARRCASCRPWACACPRTSWQRPRSPPSSTGVMRTTAHCVLTQLLAPVTARARCWVTPPHAHARAHTQPRHGAAPVRRVLQHHRQPDGREHQAHDARGRAGV